MKPSLLEIAHQSLSLSESAFLKHYKRGRFKAERGVAFTGSELPGPGFNFAACLGPCPPLEEVEKMGREFFAEAEAGWGILVEGGAGHPMEAELIAAGWAVAEDEPAFVMTPLSPDESAKRLRRQDSSRTRRGAGGEGRSMQEQYAQSQIPSPLTPNPSPHLSTNPVGKADHGFVRGEGNPKIRPVLNEVDRATFQNICTVAFQAPPELADLIMPSLAFALDPQMGWFIAEVDGKAVSCGGYYRYGQTAVICCLATLPEYRGRGLGAAVTNHGLAHAAERGCVNASLRSGPNSVPLYERLGFQYVCQHRTYAAPTGERPV
jgi:GNAT superfamily N-acetyltransferase